MTASKIKSIVLEYKRVLDPTKVGASACSGRVYSLGEGEDSEPCDLCVFSEISYASMMARFAGFLRGCKDAAAIVQRTDRPGLQPVSIAGEIYKLLIDSPADAIRMLSPEPRTIVVRDSTKALGSLSMQLRAGEDTLADAFGEELYLKVRDNHVEYPVSGRWKPLLLQGQVAVVDGLLLRLIPSVDKARWAAVRTEDLLSIDAERFYLPRRWNVGGPWISKQDLSSKYDIYLKEKEHVQRS